MTRHPATEGNELKPKRVDASGDVTVPDGEGGRISLYNVGGGDGDAEEDVNNYISEKGSFSVVSTEQEVDTINFSKDFEEITGLSVGCVDDFNTDNAQGGAGIIDFNTESMDIIHTVNGFDSEIYWTAHGIEA